MAVLPISHELERCSKTRLYIGPTGLVLVLLLGPIQFRPLVPGHLLFHQIVGKGAQLRRVDKYNSK